MVCHHCGLRYIEFFPSARQENLFIGMLHGFSVMGVPRKVYTDNMKSVVVRRLADGTPVWNKDYEAFQKLIGFKTYGSNVKEVTTQVSEAVVDCGIIYQTDAYSAGLTVVDTATSEMCGQVIYPAAILNVSKNPDAAQALQDYLTSDAGDEIFASVGFTPMA